MALQTGRIWKSLEQSIRQRVSELSMAAAGEYDKTERREGSILPINR